MKDYIGAIQAGYDNDKLNELSGTTGKDYIGAVSSGYTNDMLNGLVDKSNSTPEVKDKQVDTTSFDKLFANGIQEPQSTPESIQAGQSVEPNEAIEGSIIDPTMIAGMGLKATAYGASKFAGGAMGEIAGSIGAEGVVKGIDEATKGDFQEQYPTTTAGLKLAGGLAGGYAGGRLEGTPSIEGSLDGVSVIPSRDAGVDVLPNRTGLEERQVQDMIEGVPEDQQARVIAEQAYAKDAGVLTEAIKDSDETRIAHGQSITKRAEQADLAAGKGNHKEAKEAIDNQFTELHTAINNDSINGVKIETDGMANALTNIRNDSFLKSPLEGKIDGVINKIEGGRVSTVEDVVTIYRDMNQLYAKAKGSDKKRLGVIKDRIEKQLMKSASPETIELFKSSNDNFSRLKVQEDVFNIIDKAKKDPNSMTEVDGVSAVNWTKLYKDMKSSGLQSKEADAVIKIAAEYSNKFGSMDLDTKALTKTVGEKQVNSLTDELGAAVGRLGVRWLLNKTLENIPFNDNAKLLRTQKEIARAIRSSNTPEQVLAKVINSDFTGSNIRKNTKHISPKKRGAIEPELTKQSDTFGIKPTSTPKPKSKQPISSLEERLGTQKKEAFSVEEPQQSNTFGINPTPTPNKATSNSNGNLNDLLSPNKPTQAIAGEDTTKGMLGIKGNNKATRANGSDINAEKANLKSFLDGIANPKVNVDNKKINDLYNMLKGDSTTMYAATPAKEKAWNEAMDIVNAIKSKGSITPKAREQVIEAIKKYHNLMGDTI